MLALDYFKMIGIESFLCWFAILLLFGPGCDVFAEARAVMVAPESAVVNPSTEAGMFTEVYERNSNRAGILHDTVFSLMAQCNPLDSLMRTSYAWGFIWCNTLALKTGMF